MATCRAAFRLWPEDRSQRQAAQSQGAMPQDILSKESSSRPRNPASQAFFRDTLGLDDYRATVPAKAKKRKFTHVSDVFF